MNLIQQITAVFPPDWEKSLCCKFATELIKTASCTAKLAPAIYSSILIVADVSLHLVARRLFVGAAASNILVQVVQSRDCEHLLGLMTSRPGWYNRLDVGQWALAHIVALVIATRPFTRVYLAIIQREWDLYTSLVTWWRWRISHIADRLTR